MHPMTERFVGSASELEEILQNYNGPRSPVIESLSLLSAMIAGNQTANGALFIARNTSVQEEDADLGILMLAFWARALVLQVRKLPEKSTEAKAVLHRARNLMTSRTPREIRALADFTAALLLEAQGNITDRDALIRKALKALPAKSPRQPWLIAQYAIMLARSGRISEIEKRLSALEASPKYPDIAATALLARFIDQVEACNLHQAEQLLSPLGRIHLSRPYCQFHDNYRVLLPMLRTTLSITPKDAADPLTADEVTPDWSLVIRSLASGNSTQALKWARISEKREPMCLTGNNVVSLNLLRAELSERNIDAARRLIALRRSHGNVHYLDSFFECRALLLEGSVDQAAELFCDAARAAEQHHARHRLELEMALAVELPHHIILKLAERFASGTKSTKASKLNAASPVTVLPAQGAASGATSIIGASQATEELRRTVIHFAKMDVPVMITGETGTGKDLIAHAIHEESDRLDSPFIAVNCASISESLLESELFGHEKGAFTGASSSRRGLFEEAGAGVIFLDEIGEISSRLQAALLRVLETGEIRPVGSSTARKTNCRILTATNADLPRMAQDGRFRQDILFRLKRLEISIPPLRDRKDDILPLASFFLNQNRTGDSNAVMSEDLCRLMLSYAWPGNVRELRNVIERMRLMNSDKLYYEVPDIGLPIATHLPVAAPAAMPGHTIPDAALPRQAIPVARRAVPQTIKKGRSRMRRLELLKEMFDEHRTLTRSEIIEATGISPNVATADLKQLASEGYIDRIQPSKSPRSAYFRIRE